MKISKHALALQIGQNIVLEKKFASNYKQFTVLDDVDFHVFRTYKDILDCYYVKTATLCGLKAASLFKSLAINVINKIITHSCRNVYSNPIVKNPMPEQYVYSTAYKVRKLFKL